METSRPSRAITMQVAKSSSQRARLQRTAGAEPDGDGFDDGRTAGREAVSEFSTSQSL